MVRSVEMIGCYGGWEWGAGLKRKWKRKKTKKELKNDDLHPMFFHEIYTK